MVPCSYRRRQAAQKSPVRWRSWPAPTDAASSWPSPTWAPSAPGQNALLTSLRELRQRPGIEAIYLLDAQQGEGEPTPTIAVRPNVAGTTAETSLGEVARLVAATAPSGQRIDVVMADDALDGEAARLGAGLA